MPERGIISGNPSPRDYSRKFLTSDPCGYAKPANAPLVEDVPHSTWALSPLLTVNRPAADHLGGDRVTTARPVAERIPGTYDARRASSEGVREPLSPARATYGRGLLASGGAAVGRGLHERRRRSPGEWSPASLAISIAYGALGAGYVLLTLYAIGLWRPV